MYQFSRSIFRELAPGVIPSRGEDETATRMRFLRACEASMERLASDRHYFAKPVRTLFDGSPVCCHASTRRGTPCARVPLPGSKYCPSHKHLDEEFEVAAA
jgi:hypothetical protein